MSVDGWATFGVIGALAYMIISWLLAVFPFFSKDDDDKDDE